MVDVKLEGLTLEEFGMVYHALAREGLEDFIELVEEKRK